MAWSETPTVAPLRLEFYGSGAEYFKIWIVNIALSILTLGVFSAWAKVRNKRYFYGNTRLDGAAFDYTAQPLSILIGRLIMVAYVLVYTILGNLYPIAQLVMIVLTIPVIPWVVNRALAFTNRYSAHRGLRFGFEGDYWSAFAVFIGWPLLALVTFGLAWPLAAHRAKRYIVENSRYGRCHFAFNAQLSSFYTHYTIALVLVFGLLLFAFSGAAGMVGLQVLVGGDIVGGGEGGVSPALPVMAIALVSVAYALILIVPATYVRTMITNHVWQTSRLQRDEFDMRMHVGRVLWIQVSNLFLIVLSLGLFVPFAKVRMLRYRLNCFGMNMREGPAVYLAGRGDTVAATGDELGEAFNLDLGL